MGRERTGSIVEKKGKIYARVRFRDENGKLRDLMKVADSKADAKVKLKELLKQSETLSAKQLDAVKMTLRELAEFYRKNYLHKAVYVGEKKVSGVRGLEAAIYALNPVVEYFGSYRIKDITYGDINRYKQFRLSTPTKHDTQRSIAAVNKELGKLKRMFNIAIQEQFLARNPFSNGVSLITDEEHRTRVLSFDEEQRLLQAIKSNPYRKHLVGIVLIALDCALRRGEIFTLKWSDCDLTKRTITVRAFNSKTARKRTVAMTSRVYSELMRIWSETENYNQDALIFGVSVTIKTAWKKICKEAQIENFRFHDCRHTAITRIIKAGMTPVEAMKISGHTTLRAFNIYANLEANAIFQAANALDKYLTQVQLENSDMEISKFAN